MYSRRLAAQNSSALRAGLSFFCCCMGGRGERERMKERGGGPRVYGFDEASSLSSRAGVFLGARG